MATSSTNPPPPWLQIVSIDCCSVQSTATALPDPQLVFTFSAVEFYSDVRCYPLHEQRALIARLPASPDVLSNPYLFAVEADRVFLATQNLRELFQDSTAVRQNFLTQCVLLLQSYGGNVPRGLAFHTDVGVYVTAVLAGEAEAELISSDSFGFSEDDDDDSFDFSEDEDEDDEVELGEVLMSTGSASDTVDNEDELGEVLVSTESASAAEALDDDWRCSICFDAIQDDETQHAGLARLRCSHLFHYECIAQWLEVNPTCPLCRYKLLT